MTWWMWACFGSWLAGMLVVWGVFAGSAKIERRQR
jgi:hypothetical protein